MKLLRATGEALRHEKNFRYPKMNLILGVGFPLSLTAFTGEDSFILGT